MATKQTSKNITQTYSSLSAKGKQHDTTAGLATVLTFLGIAVFLYFTPGFFSNVITTKVVSICLAAFGIIGLGLELNQMEGRKKVIGTDGLSLGLVLVLAWVVGYHFSPGWWWMNTMLLVFLFIPGFGLARGIIRFVGSLLPASSVSKQFPPTAPGNISIRLFLVIAQIATFILTMLQIAQIFKLIK